MTDSYCLREKSKELEMEKKPLVADKKKKKKKLDEVVALKELTKVVARLSKEMPIAGKMFRQL